jgi:hypothetical protein
VKSQWAIKYKFDTEQALEKSLVSPKREIPKRKTKGMFNPQLLTNAGNWLKDKQWQRRSNVVYHSMEMAREEQENSVVARKHEQKKIQYMALEN